MNKITKTLIDVLKSQVLFGGDEEDQPEYTLADSVLEAIEETVNEPQPLMLCDFVESLLDDVVTGLETDGDADMDASVLAVSLLRAALDEVDWDAALKAIKE